MYIVYSDYWMCMGCRCRFEIKTQTPNRSRLPNEDMAYNRSRLLRLEVLAVWRGLPSCCWLLYCKCLKIDTSKALPRRGRQLVPSKTLLLARFGSATACVFPYPPPRCGRQLVPSFRLKESPPTLYLLPATNFSLCQMTTLRPSTRPHC